MQTNMKFKLSFLLLLAFVMYSYASLAQEKRSIEIIVSDTVILKPVLIKYQISSGDLSNPYSEDYPQSAGDAAAAASLDEVSLALKNAKFTYAMTTDDNYTISKSVQNKPSIMVTMQSKEELERLKKVLDVYKGISGKISSVDFESPVRYHEIMFKRLYDKAFAEANIFAKLAGTTVDKLGSAAETGDQYGGYMDWLMELSKTASQYDLFNMNAGLTKVYTRKFSFKFELK
jgi:hypothetical protein